MTILSVAQQAAPYIGITVPSVLFSGTDRTSIELQECVNESAKGICEDFDWQRFRKLASFTGDGSYQEFDLPSDYARMLKKSRLWPSDEPNLYLHFIEDSDKWLELEVQEFDAITRRYTIYGNQIHVRPTLEDGVTVQYFYISNLIVRPNTGPDKTAFTADDDTFLLPERLLKLAVIWRWKANKGRPYEQDKINYELALDNAAGTDRGPRSIKIGSPRYPSDVVLAYPRALGQ